VFDVGISTAAAISRLKARVPPEKAGCAGARENGNGGLMRIAPPVFFLAERPEAERFGITRTVSSITHAHAWSVAACFICLEYLRKLALGMEKRVAYGELCGDFSEGKSGVDAETLGKFARILGADISGPA
jgi:ADP-ribosylglycohydrolase